MAKINPVLDFIQANNVETDSLGNCHFDAFVKYSSNLHSTKSFTEVLFVRNGYDDGQISLTANMDLSVERYHLDFTERFQTYEFHQVANEFVIKGRSDKMGGDYRVVISLV